MEDKHTADGQREACLAQLPRELQQALQVATGSEYLDALARATLYPHCTDHLFVVHEPLIPEVAARWIESTSTLSVDDQIAILSAFARIIQFAEYLRPHLTSFLSTSPFLATLKDATTSLTRLSKEYLQSFLLSYYRLCTYDLDKYANYLHPALLSPLIFQYEDRAVRYLAIRCLARIMRLADAVAESLIAKNVDTFIRLPGDFDGVTINFRVLELHEEKRWETTHKALFEARESRETTTLTSSDRFKLADLAVRTARFGGVLLPRKIAFRADRGDLPDVPTVRENKRKFAQAFLNRPATLVAGESGSGKTYLISECARELGQAGDMVSLQLNAQSDARSLIGTYTSSSSGKSFVWQPGVLVKALQEGRWVVIEDIDRASPEASALIHQIVEKGELFLPNQNVHLRPSDGFRIIATIKAQSLNTNVRAKSTFDLTKWAVVTFEVPRLSEVREMLQSQYPNITALLDDMLSVHKNFTKCQAGLSQAQRVQLRDPSLRELMKWARRTEMRFRNRPVSAQTSGTILESETIAMFKDAVDCYVGHVDNSDSKLVLGGSIAQTLRVSPQMLSFLLNDESSLIEVTKDHVRLGRTTLQVKGSSNKRTSAATFAFTRTARQDLERFASATGLGEPVLLVGETGVGKTTTVQRLATMVGQRLTVVNLSTQSEGGDLLGGLKPISAQTLVVPIYDQFMDLFDETFSAKKNERFQQSLRKAFKQQNWERLLKLWQEALKMAENALKITNEESTAPPSKRRKLETPRLNTLRSRWAELATSLDHLRARMSSTSQNMVFEFVESRLVQAVRSGEWLLLDEINLASSDTLDHILSLLQSSVTERPLLMITEKGGVERIEAHPDFRLFAAMNPANDTGKRQLSSDIRSRFTEFFVNAGDGNMNDLCELIEAYLGSLVTNDGLASKDLANAYMSLKNVNLEHKLSDGAGEIPHFSLRSLVRCLQYTIQNSSRLGLRVALLEGFAMSFLTTLNKESEVLVLVDVKKHLLSRLKNPASVIAQLAKRTNEDPEYCTFKHHRIRRGSQHASVADHYVLTASISKNLEKVARAASMNRFPVLLQGPTSSGKTSMVQYLANVTGNRMLRINNHEHTDIQEYLGNYSSGPDGKLLYRDGVMVEALRNGYWVVLDELNLAPSDVLEALNRLLDDNRELLIPETQEVIRPHPNFMLFATQNPAGLYGGRKRLSRAFRNRFLEIHFDDIPETELEIILTERSQIPPSYCSQIVAVYKALSLQRQSSRLFEERNSFVTLRDLFRWASRPSETRQQLAENGFMLLAERVRDENERQVVRTTIQDVFKLKIEDALLYGPETVDTMFTGADAVVWTPAMRRLFVLIKHALANNEPILLVGETGCGKTQVCQVVASALGKRMEIFNANANTETGDLIGSQRPLRNRADIIERLRTSLSQALERAKPVEDIQTLEELLANFAQLDKTTIQAELLDQIYANQAQYNALFEWVDGSLVNAMRQGHLFLLDEISLAEDSVLERLNSVLEPARTILLAEKGGVDNAINAADGFQFLATMNPGGDYGKRELSTALRNRLTEIWVPPLTEEDDILPILTDKLAVINQADFLESLTSNNMSDSFELARRMLAFASWFRDNYAKSAAATVPLRNLLAWAAFIIEWSKGKYYFSYAILHGAALVFIDALGTDAIGLSSISEEDVRSARLKCFRELAKVFDMGLDWVKKALQHADIVQSLGMLKVGDFFLDTKESKSMARNYSGEIVLDTPATRQNLLKIVRAMQTSRPILLEGDPGVGKTALISRLAGLTGCRLTRINLSDQTDLMDLFGADVPADNENLGNFNWRDGPLLEAMQSGGWVLLDEMNLASQSVLEGLNSCLDHRQEVFIAELNKTFTCHSDFRLFAAQNPHSQGGGRKGLPESFMNRFSVLYIDAFQQADLQQIIAQTFEDVADETREAVLNCWNTVRSIVAKDPVFRGEGYPWEFNLRDLTRWFDLVRSYPTLDPTYHSEWLVNQRFRTHEQRSSITSALALTGSQHHSLYHNLQGENYQVGIGFLERNQLQQLGPPSIHHLPRHLLKYAETVMEGVSQNWPIILSGHSHVEQTNLIRYLASVTGQVLLEFSMTGDTDTMDLLGGFEQYDRSRDLADRLNGFKVHLHQAIVVRIARASENTEDLSTLLSIFSTESSRWLESCAAEEIQLRLAAIDINLSNHFEQLLIVYRDTSEQLRFVWKDSILINSLEQGHWLVLENANLCNSSVLDRLNSLLELNGSLIVTEQHTTDQKLRTIKPHPDFRIFLTIDSRRGELSRAMRNRSLEVCILETIDQDAVQRRGFSDIASIARLRTLQAVEIAGPDEIQDVAAAAADHLSVQDLELLTETEASWLSSAARGAVQSAHMPRRYLHGMKPEWSATEADLLEHVGVSEALRRAFPLKLLFHKPWLAQIGSRDLQAWCSHLAQLQDAFAEGWISFQTTLKHESQKSPYALSRAKKRNGVPPFHFFLNQLNMHVSTWIIQCLPQRSQNQISLVRECLAFGRCVFHFAEEDQFRNEYFQALVRFGQDLAVRLTAVPTDKSSNPDDVFRILGEDKPLQSGKSMQQLWVRWRPRTIELAEDLKGMLMIENALFRIDRAARAGARTRSKLGIFRQDVLRTYQSIQGGTKEKAAFATEIEASTAHLIHADEKLPAQKGHFAGVFDELAPRLTLSRQCKTDDMTDQLDFYTSNTPECIIGDVKRGVFPRNMEELTAHVHPGAEIIGFDHDLSPFHLLRESRQTLDQSIGDFTSAQEELDFLCRLLCSHADRLSMNVYPPIRQHLVEMIAEVVRLDGEGKTDAAFEDEQHRTKELPQFCRLRFNQINELLGSENDVHHVNIGQALILFSVSCLELFVPDQPYDPALLASVTNAVLDEQIIQLQREERGLTTYENYFTGQSRSIVLDQVHGQIESLQLIPKPTLVFRPERSETDNIHAVFQRILKSQSISPLALEIAEGRSRNFTSLVQAVSEILARLHGIGRAYDDICKPVAWLLKSLVLGCKLASADLKNEAATNTLAVLASRVPLLGEHASHVERWTFRSTTELRYPTDIRLSWLKHIRLQATVHGFNTINKAPVLIHGYLEVLDTYYVEWKTKLGQDQVLEQNRSRYYAYRGADEDNEEEMQREQNGLFPTFELTESDQHDEPEPANTEGLAGQIAGLQQQICGKQINSIGLEDHVEETLSSISTDPDQTTEISLTYTLPAVLLRLQRQIAAMKSERAEVGINIYADGDIYEARQLLQIVESVRTRFKFVAAAWPEHATPQDILRLCDKISQMSLSDPIAKLLTIAENLFETVEQWQSIASREFSAAAEQEQLSQIIIKWRRMELSSWAKLLDREEEQHKINAGSWFFMLYEAIIVNPRRLVEEDQLDQKYLTELVSTLQDFLRGSTLGEYLSRLELVRSFGDLLEGAMSSLSDLRPIWESLTSVVQYFDRFKVTVENQRLTARKELDRLVAEQIKLGSWKDANPRALRDSARKSHARLFRVVRKYRKVLALPVEAWKADETTQSSNEEKKAYPDIIGNSPHVIEALKYCGFHVPGWNELPRRITESVSGANSIRNIYEARTETDDAKLLLSFQDDLKEQVRALRKETPTTMNEDNAALVRHLKERKRRLYVDTTRFIANLGIRRNLNSTELELQSSTAKLLARSPSLSSTSRAGNDMNAIADHAFYKLLDAMPQARMALANHSDEISDGQIRRSVGLLEGVLAMVVRQRTVLQKHVEDASQLRDLISTLRNLQSIELEQIKLSSHHLIEHGNALKQRLAWLPHVFGLAVKVLEIHMSNTKNEGSELVGILNTATNGVEDILTQLGSLVDMPRGIVTTTETSLREQTTALMSNLGENIVRLEENCPNLEYITSKVKDWTRLETMTPMTNGVFMASIAQYMSAIHESLDLVFVAMQSMQQLPVKRLDEEQEAGWFVDGFDHDKMCLKTLHLSQTTVALNKAIELLPSLHTTNASLPVSLLVAAMPILEQYSSIAIDLQEKLLSAHVQLVNLAVFVTKTFSHIATEGFCTPADANAAEEKSGKLEAGTGLGEGEGAEDISAEVGDDEDLSEFAQADKAERSNEPPEKSKDAVAMDQDEMEGDFDEEGDEDGEESGRASGQEDDAELNEETGSVGDLDPGAVDEKMWDEAGKEAEQKELQSEKAKGDASTDQTRAEQDAGSDAGEEDNLNQDGDEGLDDEPNPEDKDDAGVNAEGEQIDPFAKQQETMELPEDMDFQQKEGDIDDGLSDDMMDELSDIDDGGGSDTSMTEQMNTEELEKKFEEGDVQDEETASTQDAVRDEEDEPGQDLEGQEKTLHEDGSLMQYEYEEDQQGDSTTAGGPEAAAKTEQKVLAGKSMQNATETPNEQQEGGEGEQNRGKDDKDQEKAGASDKSGETDNQDDAIKKLADVLERWHRRREILPSSDKPAESGNEEDLQDADMEHVQDEDDAGQAQASGTVAMTEVPMQDLETGVAIDESKIDDDNMPQMDDIEDVEAPTLEDRLKQLRTDVSQPEASTSREYQNRGQKDLDTDSVDDTMADREMDDDFNDEDSSGPHMRQNDQQDPTMISPAEASRLWAQYSASSHALSLHLTEQLRMILTPTQATKLRGDYRTGKRLNIKRIIPYIASRYKRDKIWMRRSVPTKRNYQILIAVDDSKSMMEGGAASTTLETLAMLCKSLSSLEVGDLCVLAFGRERQIRIAHEFGQPFSSSSSGPEVFRNFTFAQNGTDVLNLVKESTRLFRDARAKQQGQSQDQWQLQIIISDGICENHDEIQRLVRQASSEKIMIVFVIVDYISSTTISSSNGATTTSSPAQGQSVLDLTRATFEPDTTTTGEADEKGEMKLTVRRYLETFPFPCYLIVRDARELPGVLATALKGWFERVGGVEGSLN